MTEDELLECQHCCGDNVEMWYEVMGNYFHARCMNCYAEGPYKHSKEEAIAAWNSRVFPSWLREKIEELKQGYYCSDVLDKVLSLTPGDNP